MTKMLIMVTKMMIAVTKMLTTMTKMLVTMIIMKLLQESQLSRERAVADARLSTITAQLARFLFFVFIITLIRPSLPQSSVKFFIGQDKILIFEQAAECTEEERCEA